jgi:hypothetical protein
LTLLNREIFTTLTEARGVDCGLEEGIQSGETTQRQGLQTTGILAEFDKQIATDYIPSESPIMEVSMKKILLSAKIAFTGGPVNKCVNVRQRRTGIKQKPAFSDGPDLVGSPISSIYRTFRTAFAFV